MSLLTFVSSSPRKFLRSEAVVPYIQRRAFVFVQVSYIMAWMMGNAAGSAYSISYGCTLPHLAGLLANEGNSRPGGAASVASLLGSSFLPLPFLRLCFPFVSFFFFYLLSFPLNDEKKSDSHRTQTLAKGKKARIIYLVLFHLYFCLFFLIL